MKLVVCTPTKNRRWAWEFSKYCMSTQKTQPTKWIVVDNSTSPGLDWSVAKDHPLVQYEKIEEEKPIGWLRNRTIELALEHEADFIIFWDDDDYYPPTRISAGVEALLRNPEADISGSSMMYLLLTRENVLMTTGPFHDQHTTAATMTIRRRYAEKHRFDPEKKRGEEVTFTKEWTAKVAQTKPEDMIVVMGHGKNTVDKSDLLKRPHVYNAKVVNDSNGKMVFRVKWPVKWDLWKTTFSDEAYVPPPVNNPKEEVQTAVLPTLHIEDTVESSSHRA